MTTHFENTHGMTVPQPREGLDALLLQVTARLEALAGDQRLTAFDTSETSALPRLCKIFGLSDAEAELLVLAVGCELSDTLAQQVTAITGSPGVGVAIALRLFGRDVWDMLCPEAPLRHWHLIDLTGQGPLRQREIRVDERIVQALLGNTYIDARLTGLLERIGFDELATPSASFGTVIETISRSWSNSDPLPVILLGGKDRRSQRGVAAEVASEFGLDLFRLHARDIPTDWSQSKSLALFVDRELALSGAALIIETSPDDVSKAAALADRLTGPTIIIADDPPLTDRTPRLRLDLAPHTIGSQRDIWRMALGRKTADRLGPAVDALAGQFSLDPASINSSVAMVGTPDPNMTTHDLGAALWHAARLQGRRALNGLADRVESAAEWQDLILPDSLISALKDVAAQVRDAWRVNNDWGWADKSPRGLGTAALFAGPSGTGKTLAAEVLANDLSLDLYRVDLSQIISKYIGETEKNLSRIFAAAEDGGAVLLFDEADALFGKRSEVKDSHDRYANVEVSYLLQKMESYRGLAILTTNQKSALDTAFLRRLRYVLTFPFPDTGARADIWRRIFPNETPLEALDYDALAGLSISGGSIRSIALNASYLAAGSHGPVTMAHIRRATFREYAKLGKPVTAIEKGSFS
ncbi:ATP-binding protein [Tateyamaria pelophila]|uniref:ATP-binding protein n=1 Tax=Tateyamaria pelophila TaxID=328415 RepID=UPI001CBEF45A|nr:ATP-binding protein [Tateyamaria pelophila]